MKSFKFYLLMTLTVGLLFGINACKKNNTEDDTTSQVQQSQDVTMQINETENSLNDVNTTLSYSGMQKGFSIANATIDSNVATKTITITYHGDNADKTRNRSGQISIQLTSGTHWKDANAVITVTFTNLKITRNADGKSVTFNGTHVVTNVTGGLVSQLTKGNSITHTITGAMSMSFDNSTSRSWNVSRQRVFAVDASGNMTITVSGIGSNPTVVSGINRNNVAFSTEITTPVVFSQGCNWVPVSGVKVHKGIARSITVTFGLDAAGNPASGSCPTHYRINWTNAKNQAKTALLSY